MSEHMDNLKETLSAIMDNEADDLELRRVLKAVAGESSSGTSELKNTWHRYHQLRATLVNKEGRITCSDGFLGNIQAGIAQDSLPVRAAAFSTDSANRSNGSGKSRWAMAFGQGAIAASVAALVLVGSFQVMNSSDQQQTPELAESSTASDTEFQMAANESLEPTDFSQMVNLSGELDAQSQDRLRQAVYREFEQSSESLPVSFQFEGR